MTNGISRDREKVMSAADRLSALRVSNSLPPAPSSTPTKKMLDSSIEGEQGVDMRSLLSVDGTPQKIMRTPSSFYKGLTERLMGLVSPPAAMAAEGEVRFDFYF